MSKNATIEEFAILIHQLLRADHDVNLAIGGMTGVGKSTFLGILQQKYSDISSTYWGFDRMTWSRKELMKWIDGEGNSKEGQLPEYSAILVDELFLLFYSRNWYEKDQIDAISVFNMCRDRHLFIGGNVPNFWELDSGFRERMRFYVFIPRRGVAWVFQQETNPFSKDSWNVLENKQQFRRGGTPFRCRNFLFEVRFGDYSPEQKEQYLKIRNTKRVESLENRKKDRETFKFGKKDLVLAKALRHILDSDKKYNSYRKLGSALDVSDVTIRNYVSFLYNYESSSSMQAVDGGEKK